MKITLELVMADGKVRGLETPDGERLADYATTLGVLQLCPKRVLHEARRQDA